MSQVEETAVILVVDDEPEIESLYRLRFRKKIASGIYQLHFALGGMEALELIKKHPEIEIVLCDINMPGMDGLTLLPKLLELSSILQVVMVSAYGDMPNIRQAMNQGAYDFLTKPINFEDLNKTIEKTKKNVQLAKQARISKELEERNSNLLELDHLKTLFFTNISHELRTPLTAILATTEQIKTAPDSWMEKGLPIIERNSHRLLDLVNQVMELRKLESGKPVEVQLFQGDVISFVQYLLESFQPQLEHKYIQLDVENDLPALIMDFDPDKLTIIFSNLISNAIKFTPAGGEITVAITAEETALQLTVSDTGIGIPAADQAFVFDRFFRAASFSDEGGTGIGLSLTKELVELLGGEISVKSEEGIGSTFVVQLPISRQAERIDIEQLKKTTPVVRPVQESIAFWGPNDERPRLLIVEDNIDIAQYLRACLENEFLVHIAWNGHEGIEVAIENVPDIIISDVMMPVKNGYELCNTLKNNPATSHIPIILLTAKADEVSRLEGLEKGADAYLAKPFNRKELNIRIGKLLELRKNLQLHYSSIINHPSGPGEVRNGEDAFLWSVRNTIEEHIDEENFGIAELCRAIGVSRTQLHRKIKALTNVSTSHYLRAIRMERAKKLLLETDLNVSQVSYEVGFSDPKYFSSKFREHFGQRPSDVRKS